MSRISRDREYELLTHALQNMLTEHSRQHDGVDITIAFLCLLDMAVAVWIDEGKDLCGLMDVVEHTYKLQEKPN